MKFKKENSKRNKPKPHKNHQHQTNPFFSVHSWPWTPQCFNPHLCPWIPTHFSLSLSLSLQWIPWFRPFQFLPQWTRWLRWMFQQENFKKSPTTRARPRSHAKRRSWSISTFLTTAISPWSELRIPNPWPASLHKQAELTRRSNTSRGKKTELDSIWTILKIWIFIKKTIAKKVEVTYLWKFLSFLQYSMKNVQYFCNNIK